jgi:cyclophilin family peptidyl-prolyl cis-trans isomerase
MSETTAILRTDLGPIGMRLFPELVPRTVANFLELCQQGFYDGLLIHRVVPDLFIQTGCPRGSGLGGPGYFIEDEFSRDLRHTRPGRVSMANFGIDTGGSQFFITVTPMPWLDGQHACFGQLTSGLDVARAISHVPRDRKNKPVEPVRLHAVDLSTAHQAVVAGATR